MEAESYGSVCVEGGDGLGKGDATQRMLSELELEGVNITYSSFPIYATPIGTALRLLLRNGYEDLTPENDLDVRMALFAMNRLEFMDAYLSDKEKYKNSLLVLDRSPYSNALTVAYGLSSGENWEDEDILKYIENGMDYDRLISSRLGLGRCVIQLKAEEEEWHNSRNCEVDQYEKSEVQEMCDKVYGLYRDHVVKGGWNEVITRKDGNWKGRDEIWAEINDILFRTYGLMGDIRGGERHDIGFKEIVGNMYPGAKYDKGMFGIYDRALKGNEKSLMYENGLALGGQIAKSECLNIRISNPEVEEEFRRLYNLPQMRDVFVHFLGRRFVAKLERGLEI